MLTLHEMEKDIGKRKERQSDNQDDKYAKYADKQRDKNVFKICSFVTNGIVKKKSCAGQSQIESE